MGNWEFINYVILCYIFIQYIHYVGKMKYQTFKIWNTDDVRPV